MDHRTRGLGLLIMQERLRAVEGSLRIESRPGAGTSVIATVKRGRMTIRVLLADDHSILRDGVAALLEAQDGISVVAHAQDGREAVRKATELKPDVAVMDIVMPELDGIEATRMSPDRLRGLAW